MGKYAVAMTTPSQATITIATSGTNKQWLVIASWMVHIHCVRFAAEITQWEKKWDDDCYHANSILLNFWCSTQNSHWFALAKQIRKRKKTVFKSEKKLKKNNRSTNETDTYVKSIWTAGYSLCWMVLKISDFFCLLAALATTAHKEKKNQQHALRAHRIFVHWCCRLFYTFCHFFFVLNEQIK